MDSFDVTNVFLSKINSLEPKYASKITGFLLIQGMKEPEMKRLAYGPESLLQSVIVQVKDHLGLSSNTLPTPFQNPFSRLPPSPLPPSPLPPSPLPPSQSPRVESNNGGFLDFGKNPSPKSGPFLDFAKNPGAKSSPFLSFDNIRCGSPLVPATSDGGGGGGGGESNSGGDLGEGFALNEYFSFLNESSSPQNDEVPPVQIGIGGGGGINGDPHLHRRSFSASDACENAGLGMGFRPCQYFARGFCKHGEGCKFVHGGFPGDSVDVNGGFVGSPSEMEGFYLQQRDEMMRMKAVHQQRMAAQLMAGGISPMAYNKSMNHLLQQQNDMWRQMPPELMREEFNKQCGCRADRNEVFLEKMNPVARQIYLTFPADSSFSDEDVSNYFSTFGPVQDVRIPHQQNRMFGFVTFHRADTVKLILARGNPHFISDSRVLVKPYKEKGKLSDKRQHHMQSEMGNFSPCLSPSGLDCRDPYELHLEAKMMHNASSEAMLRRRLEEQADLHLQQSIELHRRRLMSLQLPNLKHNNIAHHHHNRSLSIGSPGSLPSHILINQNAVLPPHHVFNQNGTLDSPVDNIRSMAGEQRSEFEVPAVFAEDLSSKTEGFDHHDFGEGRVDESLFPFPKHAGGLTISTEASESITAAPGATSYISDNSKVS